MCCLLPEMPSAAKRIDKGLAANRSEIAAKIEEGYAAAQRGELIDADEVRSRLAARKQARLPKRD